jgi:hypothetical protein
VPPLPSRDLRRCCWAGLVHPLPRGDVLERDGGDQRCHVLEQLPGGDVLEGGELSVHGLRGGDVRGGANVILHITGYDKVTDHWTWG